MPIEITGLGSDLQGVGRLPDGRAVFVPGALVSEVVDISITRDKGRYCEAELTRVIEPSPDRISPVCPYADLCGGCAAAHMNYPASLAAKRQKVVSALERVGGFHDAVVSETIGMENPFRYRNKAEYAISSGSIGFRRAGSRDIVEIDDCLLQQKPSIEAMRVVREWLKRSTSPVEGWLVTRVGDGGELGCVLSSKRKPKGLEELGRELFEGVAGMRSFYSVQLNDKPASALDGVCTRVSGERNLVLSLGDLKFAVGPMSFYQVNIPQAKKLCELAVEAAKPEGENVIDAYCGVGSITLCLAKSCDMAVGVESVSQAVDDARVNARLNGLSEKTRFIAGDAAREIPKLLSQGFRASAIVVDPPRKGVDGALLEAIVKSGARRVVYVSCDPATMARDMAIICRSGEYKMGRVVPVDMFSHTSHIECVTSAVKSL